MALSPLLKEFTFIPSAEAYFLSSHAANAHSDIVGSRRSFFS